MILKQAQTRCLGRQSPSSSNGEKGCKVKSGHGAAARNKYAVFRHNPPIPAPALAEGLAGARKVVVKRGGPASGHGGSGRGDGRRHQRAFLSFRGKSSGLLVGHPGQNIVEVAESKCPLAVHHTGLGRAGGGSGFVLGTCVWPANSEQQICWKWWWPGRATAFPERDRPGGFVAHQHWQRGIDRTRRRHHPIIRHRGVEVGAMRELAALSAAAAGGVRGGGRNGGGLQRADHRGDFRGAHRPGQFFDEPVRAAALFLGGGDDGVAELFWHQTMVSSAWISTLPTSRNCRGFSFSACWLV